MPRPAPSRNAARRNLRREERALLWAFLASALLNAALLWLTRSLGASLQRSIRLEPEPPGVLDITALPPRDEPRRQTPPESDRARQVVSDINANREEPADAQYAAEQASRVERETRGAHGVPQKLRGGSPGGAAEPRGPRLPAGRSGLFPSPSELAKLLEPHPRTADPAHGNTARDAALSEDSEPLPIPSGQGLDALDPAIEEGNLTLLNRKSFRHAGFIRRVFNRVVSHYIRQLYATNTYGALRRGERGEVVVQTLTSRKGEQISTRILSMEGSPVLAEAARAAMEAGAWDLNPPAGVESRDGLVHFLLGARVEYLGQAPDATPLYRWRIVGGVI